MRPITRNVALVILGAVVLLLALGAIPSHLRAGDPHYMTATPVNGSEAAVDATNLSERRFPYTTGAVAATDGGAHPGNSDPYWRGPFGIKEAFAHSPFDELRSLEQFADREGSDAVRGSVAFVEANGTVYRLEIEQNVTPRPEGSVMRELR